jgi:hypothetical protein
MHHSLARTLKVCGDSSHGLCDSLDQGTDRGGRCAGIAEEQANHKRGDVGGSTRQGTSQHGTDRFSGPNPQDRPRYSSNRNVQDRLPDRMKDALGGRLLR